MQDEVNATPTPHKRVPWNKGKLTGAKPPLRPKHVWSIRTKLQVEGQTRDLAMFNLAIDSKLRGCDVVAIRVEDVAAGGYTADRATVRQRKTGRPVRFELSEQTRQAIDDYLEPQARNRNRKGIPKATGGHLDLTEVAEAHIDACFEDLRQEALRTSQAVYLGNHQRCTVRPTHRPMLRLSLGRSERLPLSTSRNSLMSFHLPPFR
jgi:integrase